MIHQLLNLQRNLFCIDCESTGLDTAKDRIVELAFEQWDATGMVKEWRSLVNPGIPIPPSASKIHGITDPRVRACQRCESLASCACPEGFKPVPTFKQLALHLGDGFKECDYAGKNVRFDLRILSAEFARASVPWSLGDARIIDADMLERLLVPRSLSHLYKKYTGQDFKDAHSALADVQGTTDVITQQLLTGNGQTTHTYDRELPYDLDALHALQFPGMIDLDGKFAYDKQGVPCFTRWGKHQGKPMRQVPVDYYDFICNNDFSPEVKAIAANAKLGRYPERK